MTTKHNTLQFWKGSTEQKTLVNKSFLSLASHFCLLASSQIVMPSQVHIFFGFWKRPEDRAITPHMILRNRHLKWARIFLKLPFTTKWRYYNRSANHLRHFYRFRHHMKSACIGFTCRYSPQVPNGWNFIRQVVHFSTTTIIIIIKRRMYDRLCDCCYTPPIHTNNRLVWIQVNPTFSFSGPCLPFLYLQDSHSKS